MNVALILLGGLYLLNRNKNIPPPQAYIDTGDYLDVPNANNFNPHPVTQVFANAEGFVGVPKPAYYNPRPVAQVFATRPEPRPNPYKNPLLFTTNRGFLSTRGGRRTVGNCNCNHGNGRISGNNYPLFAYRDAWHQHLHEDCYNNNYCDFM
ncbi:MAG: hypothetical protein ACPG5B_06755 [Chitinophagales bacterium]